MSHVVTINPAPTEALPLYLKRAAEKELNYGPAVFTVANAEELRAIPTAACYEGLIVILRFLLDVRDFGGGAFVWKPADTTPDNNGTAIIPTDNESGFGCWRRQESLGQPGYINIKWFGAIPFLKGFDNAPIINAAIQTLPRFAPSYPMPINGGSMRTGICYIPAGEWHVSDTVVASGSMSIRGEGTTATTLTLNDNCPLFDGAPLRMITAYSKQTQSTIGGRAMVWAFPVARITFSTPHGYTPGEQISGLIEGLVGNDTEYHTNGRWYRFHALNETQVEFLDYGPTPVSFDGAFIEFEKFILDFQWTEGNVADNDVFGTQCRSLSVVGAALTNNQNARSSGIYILGAQDSLAEDIRIWTTGIRGIHLAVPGNRVGVANIVRGPGIYTTNGYLIKHGTMHSEHVNQQATHLISDYNNPPVPRAAFMITNCFHARFQHIQGENSPLEVHIRNSSNIYFGDVAMNAAGVNQVFANAYPHTIFHFSGLTRSVTFEGASFTTGTYVHTARDVTEYAKTLGVDGYFENLAECSARTGYYTNSPVHHVLLGPYDDDAHAAQFGVPVGATYKKPGGVLTWRSIPGPYNNDPSAGLAGVEVGSQYINASWDVVTRQETVFDPNSIGGLALWLDAADASTLYDAVSGGSLVGPDGLVARWQDKSGNARHATQATSNKRPTRKVSGLNARDSLDFDGTSDVLSLASWPNLSAATAFIVCRPTSSPHADYTQLWRFGTRVDSTYFAYPAGTHGEIYDGFGTNDRRSALAPYDLDQQTNVFETVISAGTHANWLQGAALMSSAACTVAWNTTPFIGSSSADIATNFQGKIVEVVIYASALSSQDRSLVRNFLATKWGATVI